MRHKYADGQLKSRLTAAWRLISVARPHTINRSIHLSDLAMTLPKCIEPVSGVFHSYLSGAAENALIFTEKDWLTPRKSIGQWDAVVSGLHP
jgi:hypothetical protein